MKIKLEDKEKVLIDVETDKENVSLGRGSDCDIRVLNPAVSRSHLSIKVENGQLYISNISSNNWILLNGERISPNKWIPYFDFHELELPGDIQVSISYDSSTVSEAAPVVNKKQEESPALNPALEEKLRKARKNKKVRRPYESEKSNWPIKIAVAIAIIGALVYYNLPQKNVEVASVYDTCKSSNEIVACGWIKDRVTTEGVVIDGNTMEVQLDIQNRGMVYSSEFQENIHNKDLHFMFLAFDLLEPVKLGQIKGWGVERIKLVAKNENNIEIHSLNLIDLPQYSSIELQDALDSVFYGKDLFALRRLFNNYR
ncbi:MAG: hypothetical protein CME64_13925 [Halobacteriovoraceae bacterium]|nr:hypothetical protein [Halobacteriovoraceae bacterium]|tara:strand:+ start:4884 stop:5822 length:939 start_codon:yes stop_codon:yes gene_type:complete